MFGAGYLEMLARQMTSDLQRIRDSIAPGGSRRLESTSVHYGTLARRADGGWDVSRVEGLPPQSIVLTAEGAPSLVIRPWQLSGTSVSIREVTNTALNQHFGMQSTERFGVGTDPDGDGIRNEVTRGDVTALVAFQAALQVPGRVIPRDLAAERALAAGERLFDEIGCSACHIPSLELRRSSWIFTEPGPHNPTGNLRRPVRRLLELDLTSSALPQPRLVPSPGDSNAIDVPAYTDFKLHDITDPADDQAKEPLDLSAPWGSKKFLSGNRRFLTRRLWGAGNQPPYFHDGRYTTLREAVMAHAGEALKPRQGFEALTPAQQAAVIDFLGSLQVLPPGVTALVVDDKLKPRTWAIRQPTPE
jgi:Di-haem oxidoreductase, putative peroxidase